MLATVSPLPNAITAITLAVALGSCGARDEPDVCDAAPLAPSARPAKAPDEIAVEIRAGRAIWYGGRWHGRRTASGEPFDKGALTAAHRSCPLGSRVRVTNLLNGRRIIVRINDRGPYGKDRRRVIDVSEAGARALGYRDRGWTHVMLERLAAGDQAGPTLLAP